MADPVVEALPAATVVLVKERNGLEVLMVERANRGFFGGLMVFPGGGLEAIDDSDIARRVVLGESDDQRFRAGALRELAEETGIALTPGGPRMAPDLRHRRLLESIEAEGMALDGTALTLISRWVTPNSAPRRYDAWFYLAVIDEDVTIRLDETELVSHTWIRPKTALSHLESGEWQMFTPTVAHLRWLAKTKSAELARRTASRVDRRALIEPQLADDGSIIPLSIPDIE